MLVQQYLSLPRAYALEISGITSLLKPTVFVTLSTLVMVITLTSLQLFPAAISVSSNPGWPLSKSLFVWLDQLP